MGYVYYNRYNNYNTGRYYYKYDIDSDSDSDSDCGSDRRKCDKCYSYDCCCRRYIYRYATPYRNRYGWRSGWRY